MVVMKIKIYYVILFILLGFQTTMACDCSYFTFQNSFIFESYDNSEVVFLGKVESVSDEVSVFSIIELFKGKYTDQFIEFDNKGSCQLALKKDEVWLIYLERHEKDYFTNMCLPNRNYGVVSPLKKAPSPFLGEEENLLLSYERHQEVLKELELNSLRQRKLLNNLFNLRQQFYLLILISFIIILMLFLVLTIKKKD